MLDQSPHQLAHARRKPALAACETLLGDAEDLPFEAGAFDRYVSAGSVEYWPEPQRAIAEAYRVLRPHGRALVVGPVRPANAVLRRLADAWMLFPTEQEYLEWFRRAGFTEVGAVPLAPSWYRSERVPFALAVSGVKQAAGPVPLALPPPRERLASVQGRRDRVRSGARFVAGSLAGAAFVPLAAVLAARRRLTGGGREG
jgi:MPBQ/MSBQ methyltransferase